MTRCLAQLLASFCLLLPAAAALLAQDEARQAAEVEEAPAPLVLDAATEGEYTEFEDRMGRAIATSELNLEFVDAQHIRLIAEPDVAAPFLRDVERLEELIADMFPEPLAGSVDLRAANIVLLSHRSEWERWVRAMFAEFENDGYTFEGQDVLQRAIDSQSFHLAGVYSTFLENKSAEEARRSVAFAVGYHYMNQLTQHQAPDALATGFGDLAEQALFRSPSVMVFSGYADRRLAANPDAWRRVVQRRFAQDRIPSLQAIMIYSTDHMQLPQYAEGWSLAGHLADEPEKFAELVLAFREGTDAEEAILDIYEVDEEELRREWQRHAGR